MTDVNTILARYETQTSARRIMAKTPKNIADDVLVRCCNILNERASLPSTRPEVRKQMRLAARELMIARQNGSANAGVIANFDESLLNGAEKRCYDVMSEVVEEMVSDMDQLALQAAAGHPYKRRMNTIIPRLRGLIAEFGLRMRQLCHDDDAGTRPSPSILQGAEK